MPRLRFGLRPGLWPSLLRDAGDRAEGRGARAVDLTIAATARAYQLPLYTRNPSDLPGLEDLVEIVDLG